MHNFGDLDICEKQTHNKHVKYVQIPNTVTEQILHEYHMWDNIHHSTLFVMLADKAPQRTSKDFCQNNSAPEDAIT